MTLQKDVIELLEIPSPASSCRTYTKKHEKANSPDNHNEISDSGIKSLHKIKTEPMSSNRSESRRKSETITISESNTSENLTSFAEEMFTINKKKSSIQSTSKINHKSYRDRIKDRFKSIKENAGKSSYKAMFKEKSKRVIMERLRKENKEIENQFLHLKNVSDNSRNKREDIYNFFTIGASEEIPFIPLHGNLEDISESTENLIKNDEKLVQFYRPEDIKYLLKLNENELFFYPTGSYSKSAIKEDSEENIVDKNKISSLVLSCFPDQNFMEERLINQNALNWFNSDGELILLKKPNSNTSLRPTINKNIWEKLTWYPKPTLVDQECEEVLIIKERILQLNIINLKFEHHPLFSLEHVLERQLTKNCERYEHHMENLTLEKMLKEWETERETLSLKQNKNIDEIKECRKKLHELQEDILNQGKQERQLLRKIIELWKSLKDLRIKNGFSNTNIQLKIQKINVNIVEEKQKYEELFQKMYEESVENYRLDFKEKLKSYKQELTQIQQDPGDETDLPTKPKYEIDEEELLETMRLKFENSFRPPDEPILHFRLYRENNITENVDISSENLRRIVTKSMKVFLKIFCNNLLVCKTKTIKLNDDFNVIFKQNIPILLTNIPKHLTAILYEQSNTVQKKEIAKMDLSLPHQSITRKNSLEKSFELSSIINYKHAGVGSGVQIKSIMEENNLQANIENLKLKISGTIYYEAFWENGRNFDSKEKIRIKSISDDVIKKNGAIEFDKLKDWMQEINLDENNPNNAIVFDYCKSLDKNSLVRKKYFRLNPFAKELTFCNENEIDNNLRYKLLQLRNQNEPEFDGMVIPNRIKEIPLNVLSTYKRRITNEQNGIIDEEDEDDFDGRRKFGQKNLKQIHIKVFQQCKNATYNLSPEDVLDEKYLIYFEKLVRTLISNFIKWFHWTPQISQPLPELKRANVEKIKKTEELTSLVKISIDVQYAINIPERVSGIEDDTFQTNQNLVRPYVEIKFNEVFDRTSAKEGSNPIWNEQLSLTLNSSHFDYLNPNSMSGKIVVSIFDEHDENSNKDIKSRNWLGSVKVPLSAVGSSNEMEGNFFVHVPDILFGYTKEEIKNFAKFSNVSVQQNQSIYKTYISLKFSIEPNILKLLASVDELPCSDLPYLKDHIIKWNEAFNNSFPLRKFAALVINSNGKTTCPIRYIKPLEPPQLNNEGFDIEPEQCAKFVSLIPFTSCNQFYQNVWLTTDQLLRFLTGSIIDHAIALTCFLLALKLNVWLLLGFGIPHGSTAYVLLKEDKETEPPLYFIYDVTIGEKINILDPFCPLQRIFCVIGEENMWANIQRTDNMAMTRFDFSRKSDWLPLFDDKLPAPTNSIHNKISYVDKTSAEELEIKIEKKLRKLISKSRPMIRTVWNKKISAIFKNTMHLLEYVYMHNRSNYEIYNELCRNVAEYELSGFVFSSKYTTILDLIKKIKHYGVYYQEATDVEFSIAVYIQTYQNFVASVWIFFGTLKEK